MDSPLVTHAIKNVWCATNQDFQHHINLPRITPDRGVLRSYPVLWDVLAVPETPTNRDYFHFYQIGHLPTNTFDFNGVINQWINYTDLNVSDNILMDVYMVTGAIIPRDHIYIIQLYNKNLILAIKINFKIDYGTTKKTYSNGVVYDDKYTLDNSQLILRFYSNAYFNKIEYITNAVDPNNPIRHVFRTIKTQNDYTSFINTVNAIELEFENSGLGVYYQDGFVINKPIAFSDDLLGSQFSFMWDESFKFQKLFNIKNLTSFISEKNRGVRKYLLVCDNVYDVIDYHDDIDIYIVNTQTGKGVYFNRNGSAGITMVTHNTYALNAATVEGYIQAHEFLESIDKCAIRVMVRHGGRENALFNQKNRIQELYKLPYNDIVGAHVNTPSLIPIWRAAALEQSGYVALMSAPMHLITDDLVIDAYGYNGICTQFANPLVNVTNGEIIPPTILNIPDGKTNLGNRTIFCYNNDGTMIGYYHNASLSSYIAIPQTLTNTTNVECINALMSTDEVDAWVNLDVSNDDLDQYGFRCYVSGENQGEILNIWEDVTGTNLYTYTKATTTSPAEIKWRWDLLSQANLYPAVKTNKVLHVYKWSKPVNVTYDGCLEIVVKATQQWGNNKQRKPLGIPPGNVDVFANGLSLIRDVDYYMQWPTIVIINRDINRSPTINVVVRSYGFADPRTDKPFVPKEVGFVKDGKLSVNGVYDVRNNKCVRVIVDNKLVTVDSKNYGEYTIGSNYTDGKPYSITDYVLPIENLLRGYDTWTLYKETDEIDSEISNYLTPRLPEIKAITPIVNVTRWPVISPVVSSLLHGFSAGLNFDSFVSDNYDLGELDNWFKPFKWLLPFDPAFNRVDENYFRIEPHSNTRVMSVTQKQYEFLELIIKLYLNDRVDLTTNVVIG